MTISSVEAPGILTRPDIRRAEPTLGKVAVLYTTPESVLDDYGRLMNLADYRSALVPGVETLLKVNISWQHYYPACSSAPWQIEGVVNELRRGGYEDLLAAHNGTVVVDPVEGRVNNRHAAVEDRLGVPARDSGCAAGQVGEVPTVGQNAGPRRYIQGRAVRARRPARDQHRSTSNRKDARLHNDDGRAQERLRRVCCTATGTGRTR